MQLKPLYHIWFAYPRWWGVTVEGQYGMESQFFGVAEGRCEGLFTGRFVAANHPRRMADGTMCPNLEGIIETDDGAVVFCDIQGRGLPHPPGRRPFLCSVVHLTQDERYQWLNDRVCVAAGEVRAVAGDNALPRSGKIDVQSASELVVEVAELIWEPLSV